MGISYTQDDHSWLGNAREVTLVGSFDASYTAGGEPLTPGDAGLREIESVDIVSNATEGGYLPRWDDAAGTIMMFHETDTTLGGAEEVAAGTDLSAETVRLRVRGRGS